MAENLLYRNRFGVSGVKKIKEASISYCFYYVFCDMIVEYTVALQNQVFLSSTARNFYLVGNVKM